MLSLSYREAVTQQSSGSRSAPWVDKANFPGTLKGFYSATHADPDVEPR